MPGIIKSQGGSASDGTNRPVFNFEDLTSQARRALAEIRGEAEQTIRAAQSEAAAIRDAAKNEGLAAAQKTAREAANKEVEQRLSTVMTSLEKAAQQLNAQRDEWLARWEQQAVVLAIRIAEKLVRRELAADPGLPLGWIRETLELIGQQEQVTIEVAAADHVTLGPKIEQLQQSLHRIGNTRVTIVNSLRPGDCRILTRDSEFDHRIETMLRRLEEELT